MLFEEKLIELRDILQPEMAPTRPRLQRGCFSIHSPWTSAFFTPPRLRQMRNNSDEFSTQASKGVYQHAPVFYPLRVTRPKERTRRIIIITEEYEIESVTLPPKR